MSGRRYAGFSRVALTLFAPILIAQLLPAGHARAYTLGSGVSTSCHEVLTFEGLSLLLREVDTETLPLPRDDAWLPVARQVARELAATNPDAMPPGGLDTTDLFLLWSVVVGVRATDVEGHSITDLATLRLVQADPSAEGQYAHALRGRNDDGFAGDLAAIEGAKQAIRAELKEARAVDDDALIRKVPFYIDFYDNLEVDVLYPFYLFGRAAHTLQDSHAHMLRSDDGSVIYHVSNYLEAVGGELQETRDGLAHSDSMDNCRGPTDALTRRATAVTIALMAASAAYLAGDDSLLERGLSPCAPEDAPGTCGWMTYEPACAAAVLADDQEAQAELCCSRQNDYCDSKWLGVFRAKQTQPYVKSFFGCAAAGPGRGRRVPLAGPAWLAVALLLLSLRRRVRSLGERTGALTLTIVLLVSAQARAQVAEQAHLPQPTGAGPAAPFMIGLEGHVSLLNDAPRNSLLGVTLGYALRGAYRFDSWGLLLHVERNHWLPTEFSTTLKAGVLNIGVGGEYWFADGFARSSLLLGPSVLMFDAVLNDAGSVGYYLDLRPLGVRYRLGDHFSLVFDPLTVTYVQPVFGAPAVIRHLEYRTVLSAEADF